MSRKSWRVTERPSRQDDLGHSVGAPTGRRLDRLDPESLESYGEDLSLNLANTNAKPGTQRHDALLRASQNLEAFKESL